MEAGRTKAGIQDFLRRSLEEPGKDPLKGRQLVLASASPSRKMLLEAMGLSFEICVSGADETVPADWEPAKKVTAIARKKLEAVQPQYWDAVVIAADSLVALEGKTIGKPATEQEAREILGTLSGKTHQLFTGVALSCMGRERIFCQQTAVRFYPLTPEEIAAYVAAGESLGRAGGYGIEGVGALLIQSVSGDYSNVVGLPVAETLRQISALLKEEAAEAP